MPFDEHMMTIGYYSHFVTVLPDTINAFTSPFASSESYDKDATKSIPLRTDGILNLDARLQTSG